MKHACRIAVLISAFVGVTLFFVGPSAGGRIWAQGNSLFTSPNGRYYSPYRNGPYGSYSQGYGGTYSAGSPNMFSRGPAPPPPMGPINLYQNQPYGGQFYFRPMVGPAYDPFRNGR